MTKFKSYLVFVFILANIMIVLSGVSCKKELDKRNWQEILGYKAEEIHQIFLDKYNCPAFDVLINNQKLQASFDTGNMSKILISSTIANSFSLPVVDSIDMYDSGGSKKGSSSVYAVDEMSYLGISYRDMEVMEDKRDNIDMFIGPDLIPGVRFTIDYPNRLMAVSKSSKPTNENFGYVFPLVKHSHFKRMILIHGSIGGKKVLIEIDTGKSRSCIDPKLGKELGLERNKHGYAADNIKLSDLSFTVPSVKIVSFGGISQELDEPILFSVGADILKNLVFTVDYESELVMLSMSN